MNTIGHILRLTGFGESHGPAIGGVLDGFPSGVTIDLDFIQNELNRRKPGQSAITTGRSEADKVTFLSGIFNGVSTGAPIAFTVHNTDQHSSDYDNLKNLLRPSHADYTYNEKYGIRDYKGGGRASARVTIAQCVAGALSKLALQKSLPNIDIYAFTSQVGNIKIDSGQELNFRRSVSESNNVRCPDSEKASQMEELIRVVKKEGDSIGGIVTCIIKGCPIGLGEPLFGKLHAELGAAMLNINAAKGFEYGDGFESATQKGSYHNDAFCLKDGKINTASNHSGGIQGGISNGQPIRFRVAFKPTPTIVIEQHTVTKDGEETIQKATGRHDPCIVPRAVPIVENLAAMVILDHLLLSKATI
jgi:chorismate synthase